MSRSLGVGRIMFVIMIDGEPRYRLLGPVGVVGDEGALRTRGPKQRAVLAALLLHANRVVSEDLLFSLVWGDDFPPSMRGQLQVHVSGLRKLLGPAAIKRHGPGYLMEVRPGELDLQLFDSWVATGRYADALGLWRGPALGDTTESLVEREAPALYERRLAAFEAFFDAELAGGRHVQVIGELHRVAAENPFRERVQAQLMLALGRSGRQSEALEVFAAVRRGLVAELGVEPGQELRELYLSILHDDQVATQPRPAELPHDVRSFVGRLDELALLDDRLTARGPADIVVVDGMPGVGKTALAVHWATGARRRFPDGQLYVNLRGFDPHAGPVTPVAALTRLVRALGGDPWQDVEALSGQYRSLLADRNILLVLDDARTAAQVYPLLPPTGAVVVTSRNRLTELAARTGARSLSLGVLSPGESRTLLESALGVTRVAAESAAAAELARLCGHLPLALRIAANLVGAGIATLTTRLAEGRPLDVLTLDGAAESTLAKAYSLSYQALPPARRRVFRVLALTPGPDFGPGEVAALVGISSAEAARDLRALAAAHLVESHAGDRYRCHELLRHYAAEQLRAEVTGRRLTQAAGVPSAG